MDLSILAAVGSFVVSERLLRPKALIMVGLGVLLCHDLMTHSNDPASLRVYRGPGLLAFALFCGALSLRLWRRNGIACDELIFLPGTPLEDEQSRHGPFEVELENLVVDSPINFYCVGARRRLGSTSSASYVDYGVGGIQEESECEDMVEVPGDIDAVEFNGTANLVAVQEGGESSKQPSRDEQDGDASSSDEDSQDALMRNFLCGLPLRINQYWYRYRQAATEERDALMTEDLTDNNRDDDEADGINWAYAPSGASVLGAALDLSMPVLFNFHLFIAAFNHPKYAEAQTPKIFPLIFLSVLTLRATFPRGKRKRFWGSLQYTMAAPCFKVNCRDEIIGDVLTSLVRPIQDVVFSYFYYFTVIIYGVRDAAQICEKSWMLHVIVLPACAICPLWWRFLQNLRQCRDTRKRWPHLGNAFKYFTAAMIVLYDMGHPESRSDTAGASDKKMWWVLAFLSATLYQVWWDTFIDWELFVVAPKPAEHQSLTSSCFPSIHPPPTGGVSSGLALQRHVIQLLVRLKRKYCICPGDRVALRSKRMYKHKWIYWTIFALNSLFRFCWMLSFIPAKHISTTGKVVYSFSADVQSYVGPIIACAEIARRCLWGLLRVELESIKIYHTDGDDDDDGADTVSSKEQEKEDARSISSAEYTSVPTVSGSPARRAAPVSSTSSPLWSEERIAAFLDKTLTAELCLWAAAFVGLGFRAVSA